MEHIYQSSLKILLRSSREDYILKDSILKDIIYELKNANSIAILPHIYADGDSIGSSIALAMGLKALGKQVDIYMEEEIPYIYSFLPGKELIISSFYPVREQYDLVVALDSGDVQRLGNRYSIFKDALMTINIDHHGTNTEFAKINYVDSIASSTGEIIYGVLEAISSSVDLPCATCIYTAVAADTGGFRYSNTTSHTHEVAAKLTDKGVNVADICRKIFETTTYERVKLIGMASQAIELFHDGKIAFVLITAHMIKESGTKDEDCEGIVNIGRSIKGVEVSIVMRELTDGNVKISFRSNECTDVSAIAGMYGGGGHKRAAGCIIKGTVEILRQRVLEDTAAQITQDIL